MTDEENTQMSHIDRREFLWSFASLLALPLVLSSRTEAQSKPKFRFILPGSENLFAVGEIVPLRIFTKTAYPRLLVNFKVNGQLIGTATHFPYRVNWTPAQTGDYSLTAEVLAPNRSAVIGTSVKVLNLLYDAIGREGNYRYNAENSTASFITSFFPETNYAFPTQYVGMLDAPKTIRRIDLLLSATTRINNTTENIPFPTGFHYITARLWNNGITGFSSSPLNGNLNNVSLGVPNLGSTTAPFVTNSAGIKFYLTGWGNLNIPLPPNVPLALSTQFSINSAFDITERINFAHSTPAGQSMFYAGRQNNNPPTVLDLGTALAVRIWVD